MAPNANELLKTLETRFGKHMKRHAGIAWPDVLAHDGVQQRAAGAAPHVVACVIAHDEHAVLAPGELQMLAFDAAERLEGGAGGAPAARAVAVQRVAEGIGDGVADGAALAPT